jgi:Putative transmembrane protein (PGPGW).
MRPRSQNRQSIGFPLRTKRLVSVWNLENIKIVKRVIVSVVGATVLLIGFALLILPGPAFIVIPVGLSYSCQRIGVGATLAKNGSSNGE